MADIVEDVAEVAAHEVTEQYQQEAEAAADRVNAEAQLPNGRHDADANGTHDEPNAVNPHEQMADAPVEPITQADAAYELPGPPSVPAESGPAEPEPVPAEQGKRKRQRWGPAPPGKEALLKALDTANAEGQPKKKRRSRWESEEDSSMAIVSSTAAGMSLVAHVPKEVVLSGGVVVKLPSALTGQPVHADPNVQKLYDELEDVQRKLNTGDLGIPPEGQRSPSPEPVYDRYGARVNTREVRVKERLQDRRQFLIEELIKSDPLYKPPADYRPAKKWRKIYIPIKEFPGYNFIGLIIGPRGNTQKRMQKETNTKIAIRGRGSVKDGAARDPKYDYGEDEELHVLITGDTQEDVDNAALMIEDLLQPMDEIRNEHKRMQLRELATLNGTLKEEEYCYLCGEHGHRQFECPTKANEVYQLPEELKEKVEAQYQRDIARMNPGEGVKVDDEYKSFIAELGGGEVPEGIRAPPRATHAGLGFRAGTRDLPDDCKLYVGNVPQTLDDHRMRQMFERFGNVVHCIIMKDGVSGLSRGFGFVHYSDHAQAVEAAKGLNGTEVDGNRLNVRLRSESGNAPGAQGAGQRGGRPEDTLPDDCKIYVAALPPNVEDGDLLNLFSTYGPVASCRVIKDRVTGNSKCYGFVNMATGDAAKTAIAGLNGYKLGDKVIVVRQAGDRSVAPGQPPQAASPYGVPPGHPAAPPMPTQSVPGYPPHPSGHPSGHPGHPGGHPGAPMYPGMSPFPPPGWRPGMPAHMPPPGFAPPPGFPMPPPGFAPPPGFPFPPPGYGAPPGFPHHMPPFPGAPGGAPPDPKAAAAAAAAAIAARAAAAAHARPAAAQPPQQPPLPSGAPPLPSEAPPPAAPARPPANTVQNEYERFMSEMQNSLFK